jgi:MFS family permease
MEGTDEQIRFFGALTSSYTAEFIGRRKAIFAACVTATVGGALQAGSVDIGMFIFVRFISGFGVGMILVLIPLYQSEVSPPHSRGLMVGIHGVCITVGYCSSSCMCSPCNTKYRSVLMIRTGQGLAMASISSMPMERNGVFHWLSRPYPHCSYLSVFFSYQSHLVGVSIPYPLKRPRWLSPKIVIAKGRSEEALKIVQRLHRDETDPHNVFAYREYQQIRQQYEIDKRNEVSWKEMFVRPSYRKRLIIGFTVMFASQTTGTTVINSRCNPSPNIQGDSNIAE